MIVNYCSCKENLKTEPVIPDNNVARLKVESIINFFLPDSSKCSTVDAFEIRKRKLFIAFNLISLIAITIFTGNHFAAGRSFSAAINCIGAFAFFTSLFLYKLTGRYHLAASLYMSFCILVPASQHYLSTVDMQANIVWFPLVAVVGYFILPPRYANTLTVLNVAIAISSHLLPRFHHIEGDLYSSSDRMSINVFSILLSIAVGHYVGKRIAHEDKETIKSLNTRNSELLNMSEANAALVSILTHDLANHISIGNNYAKILKKRLITDDQKIEKSALKIIESFELMTSLTEEVRNLRANDSGKLSIELRPVDIKDAINSSIKIHQDKIQEKNIEIDFVTNFDQKKYIWSEPISLINSVLNNLLTNAIKFSPNGGHVEIKVVDYTDKVRVSFKDNGIGIPEKIMTDLFSPHIATTRRGTNGEAGTGFGMPIVKMFVDRYEGAIEVKSSTKGITGTEFTLTFKKWTPEVIQEPQAA